MIPPTIGRIVWYTPSTLGDQPMTTLSEDQPLAAMVVYVWGNRMVNLTVFDHAGIAHPRTSVTLLQGDDVPDPAGRYAEWMPFQKGQAKRHEEREKEAV